jgi:UPF0755 protein
VSMKRLKAAIAVMMLAALVVSAKFMYAVWLSQPAAGAPVEIHVEQGMSAQAVRELLASRRLVSGWSYWLYGLLDGSALRPKAGRYEFRRGTSYASIARALAMGQAREDVSIRLIEGKTLDDERVQLADLGVVPALFTAMVGSPRRNPTSFNRTLVESYPFLSSIPEGQSLEGYLFPDTYRVWKDDVAETLVHKQLNEFLEKIAIPFADRQKQSGLSWHEIVTLASIVEAEVRKPEDRRIVAGLFLNRLRDGMLLQTDATLNYVVGEGRTRATAEDLVVDSRYNTYRYHGLPPGPINNPGLSSLEAVLNPATTDYYFFLTDPAGKVYYGKTHAEHLRNRQRAFGG